MRTLGQHPSASGAALFLYMRSLGLQPGVPGTRWRGAGDHGGRAHDEGAAGRRQREG